MFLLIFPSLPAKPKSSLQNGSKLYVSIYILCLGRKSSRVADPKPVVLDLNGGNKVHGEEVIKKCNETKPGTRSDD